jgi:hypothetical protein
VKLECFLLFLLGINFYLRNRRTSELDVSYEVCWKRRVVIFWEVIIILLESRSNVMFLIHVFLILSLRKWAEVTVVVNIYACGCLEDPYLKRIPFHHESELKKNSFGSISLFDVDQSLFQPVKSFPFLRSNTEFYPMFSSVILSRC